MRGTGFFGQILAAEIVHGVFFKRDRRVTALLRTIVHQPILADVQITRAGAAAPLIRLALRDVVLKCIDASETAFLERLHFVINAPFFLTQGLELSSAVVNNANR